MPEDRIKREIEDLLNQLDEFVPEENKVIQMRRRSSRSASQFVQGLLAPLAGVSIRHLMLASLILIFVGFIAARTGAFFGQWVLIAGVILFLTAFGLSFFSRNSPPAVEKRWRGQPMDLREPGLGTRLRTWWRSKRRPRY